MSDRSESRDYENGVADVFGFLLGDRAAVHRNVRLPALRSSGTRQVDVLVRGDIFGLEDATLVVDCKRYRRSLNIDQVDQFLGLLDDVAADLGILMTTKGVSPKALERLRTARGARARVMTLEELDRWSPTGSATMSLRLSSSDEQTATRALREAGFRIKSVPGFERSPAQIILAALIRLTDGHLSGQEEAHELASTSLAKAGVPYEVAASGVTIGGGTPAHRWLDVTDTTGTPVGLRVLVASEEDVESELARLAADFGTVRDGLDVNRPAGWPPTGLFGIP